MCDNERNILYGVALRLFNCMSQNLVRDISESETLKSVRKIRKLTGQVKIGLSLCFVHLRNIVL